MNKLLLKIAVLLRMSSEEDKERLFKVIIPTFMVQVGGTILALGVSLILGRIMGSTNYGVYAYCASVVAGIVSFIVYGLNILSLRETSSLLALGKNAQWKGFIKWSITYLLIFSFLVSLGAALVFYYFPLKVLNDYRTPMLIACTSIPLFSLLLMISSVMRGMHKVLLSQTTEKLVKPLAFLILLIVVYLVRNHIGLYSALVLNSVAFGTGMLFILWKYRQYSKPLMHGIVPEYEKARWVKELSGLFLFSIILSIDSQIDVYMLGFLKPPADVGVYKVANNVAAFVSFFLGVSNVVLAPSFAHLHAVQDKEKLQRLVTQTIRWVMLLTAPVAIFIIIFSRWILSLWGGEFVNGQAALIMLCTAHLINSAFGSVGNLALMSKFERYNGMAIMLSILLNVVLNLLLTPKWGINGTAFACALSIVIWNVTLFFVVKHKTGIKTWVFTRK